MNFQCVFFFKAYVSKDLDTFMSLTAQT